LENPNQEKNQPRKHGKNIRIILSCFRDWSLFGIKVGEMKSFKAMPASKKGGED
jgi:hypothetical protein